MAELTPMMRQYMEIKEQNPDSILFFRLGDFYEMFGPDARTASRELDLALTTRDKDKTKSFDDKIPMCGIPYHASDAYIARLIAKGYKVAICEQTEDPAAAKGLVKRDIIRVVTPGTVIDESCLSAERSNYLCGVYLDDTGAGLCACDISTGKAQATVFTGPDRVRALLNELGRFAPAEAVMNETAFFNETLHQTLQDRFSCHMEKLSDARFTPEDAEKKVRAQFGQDALERLPRDNMTPLLALGGKGVISVLSNVAPQYTHDICAKWFAGDFDESLAMQLKALPLIKALFADVNPIPVKWAMNRLGWNAGDCRLPLVAPSAAVQAQLEKALQDFGLLK